MDFAVFFLWRNLGDTNPPLSMWFHLASTNIGKKNLPFGMQICFFYILFLLFFFHSTDYWLFHQSLSPGSWVAHSDPANAVDKSYRLPGEPNPHVQQQQPTQYECVESLKAHIGRSLYDSFQDFLLKPEMIQCQKHSKAFHCEVTTQRTSRRAAATLLMA